MFKEPLSGLMIHVYRTTQWTDDKCLQNHSVNWWYMFTEPLSGLIIHVYRIVRHIFGLLLLQSCILLVGCIVGCNPETGLSWLQSWHLFKLVAKLKLVQSDCKAETCSSWLQSWNLFKLVAKLKLVQVGCKAETSSSWLQSWNFFKLVAKLKLVQVGCKA